MACRIHLVQMGHGRFGRFDGLIGLAREQHISGAQTLLVKIVGKREREVRRVLAIDQRTGDLRGQTGQFGIAYRFDDLHGSLGLFHGAERRVPGDIVEFVDAMLQQVHSLDSQSGTILCAQHVSGRRTELTVGQFGLLLGSGGREPAVRQVEVGADGFQTTFAVHVHHGTEHAVGFLGIVKPSGVQSLEEGITGEGDGDHIAHGGIAAQHAHRIIVHAGGPISIVSADALAADTAQVVACAGIVRHAERHFVDIDALHQVFELRIDGRGAIGVSGFGRGLIRSIRRRSGTVACSPGRAAFVTGRRLPERLLMGDGAGRVAMEITIFGVGFGTHTPQIATA